MTEKPKSRFRIVPSSSNISWFIEEWCEVDKLTTWHEVRNDNGMMWFFKTADHAKRFIDKKIEHDKKDVIYYP